ncbi:MAG: hypothetical protein JWM50_2276 [Microbacteriaceae bacterium]|nr:hypothetical protein [Microbacteriaceae bacterium]
MKCRNCGAELPVGAMFCGECGASVAAPKLVEPPTRARPGDTVTIKPVARPVAAAHTAHTEVEHVAGPEPVAVHLEVEHVAGPEPVVAPPRPTTVAPEPSSIVSQRRPAPPRERASHAASVPLAMPPGAPDDRDAPSAPPVSPGRPAVDEHDDVEATRIVGGMTGGERFVLQFSTGENAIVFGSGLVGRNPVIEPGEFVDQLIAIVDSGKSVSKTHLEFGQLEGRFWVSDRFSANGTIVRQPDARPQRLEPGRRQQVARGTRIDMGEQFVVVS